MKNLLLTLALIIAVSNIFAQDPIIRVHSSSSFSLLRNCSNKVIITAPELGEKFSPQFEVEGGTFVDAGGGLLAITPKTDIVKIKITNDGKLIATESFRVRDIPQPVIMVKQNGERLDFEKGLADVTGELEPQVVPNKDFAIHFPPDARYRVTKWSIAHMRGSQQLNTIKSSSQKVDLSQFVDTQPGDFLVLKFNELQRLNHQTKREVINIDPQSRIRIIPII